METLTDLQNFLMGAGPFALTFFCGIVAGYLIKSMPFITNQLIPLLVVLACSFIFRFTQKVSLEDHQQWFNPEFRLYLVGGLIGFATWIAHNKFLKKWIDDRFGGNVPPPSGP